MPASLIDADSLLAVDVGSMTTHATLFDVVEGHYRFIAAGQAASTAAAPFKDISEGVHQAIENLQTITGRKLIGDDHRLIMPVEEGNGVDSFTATLSAGPAIKTAVVGLLNDVSVESAQRLARTCYARVVDTLSLNDQRKADEQIDSLLRQRPELIVIAGGTDQGASRSVERLLETVGLACYLMPADKHPAVLFAGNKSMVEKVKSNLQNLTSYLSISPNLRPTLEVEDLQPAQRAMAETYTQLRRTQMGGVDELSSWAGGTLIPTAYAEGRIARVHLEPQPDDAVSRFPYDEHVAAISGPERRWPVSTRRVSQLRVTIEFERASAESKAARRSTCSRCRRLTSV